MPYVERPPRAIVCSDCGAAEKRSPYGPAPKYCIACGEQRSRDMATRSPDAVARKNAKHNERRQAIARRRKGLPA